MKAIRTGVLAIGLLVHAYLGWAFRVTAPANVPARWAPQFIGLLIFSFLLTPVMHLSKSGWLTSFCFCLRSLTGLLILQAMPAYLGTYGLLIDLLALEGCLFFSRMRGGVAGLLLLAMAVWQRYANAITWGVEHPGPAPFGMAAFVLGGLTALILGALLRLTADLYHSAEKRAERFREASNKLVEANVRLQENSVAAQRESIISERNRISREIHDSVGYALTNLIAVLDYARELLVNGKGDAIAKLDNGRDLARGALTDVRRAVKALRPPIEISLLAAIMDLVSNFAKATGIDVSIQHHDLPMHLGEKYDAIVMRIIQETLANSFRHGQPAHVSINLSLKAGRINLSISDDGEGTDMINYGCGLTGIRERVEELHGSLSLESSPGRGFSIQIWLPWRDERWS